MQAESWPDYLRLQRVGARMQRSSIQTLISNPPAERYISGQLI